MKKLLFVLYFSVVTCAGLFAQAAPAAKPTYQIEAMNSAQCRLIQGFIPTACTPYVMAIAEHVPAGAKVEFEVVYREVESGAQKSITLYAEAWTNEVAVVTQLIGVDFTLVSSAAKWYAPMGSIQIH